MDPVLHRVLRVSLAGLFAVAASHKLRAPVPFAATLAGYALLPAWALKPVAVVLPALEVALVLALLAPVPGAAAVAAAGGAALLAVYSAAIGINLARGRTDIDCGCLGPAAADGSVGSPLSAGLLARNAALALACCAVALPAPPRAFVWVDALTIAAGASGVALCWIAAHHLARLPLSRRAT